MPPPDRPTTRSSIPFEIEAFRTRPRHGKRALWALLACLAAGVTAWVLLQPAPETPESPALLNVSAPRRGSWAARTPATPSPCTPTWNAPSAAPTSQR